MIRMIKGPRELRRFTVWDLEWIPRTYQLRICGVYDENGYRSYRSIREFLCNELTISQAGRWFYAHFGGGADLQFILEEVLSDNSANLQVRGSFSGSSCVICHAKRGRHSWHFVDSYWLLRSKLKDIAKWIGEEKTGPTDAMTQEEKEEWFRSVDFKTLREYNKQDCVVLWKAIGAAQDAILDLGGQLQMTLASTSLQLFRRKYLTQDVQTSRMLDRVARESYTASRVEVYQHRVDYPGLYYDVNSSFPYAMTFALPGELRAHYNGRIPSAVWEAFPFLADCSVRVADVYLPPLPYRFKSRVFFPVGRWRGWFTGIDLKLLVDEGGIIEKVHSCKAFEPFHDLRAFANDLYDRRRKSSDKFEREMYKLLLNSLYGKFAEQPDKLSLIINPDARTLQRLDRQESMCFPGAFLDCRRVPIPHAHVVLSSYITAIARRTLYQYMEGASEIHYCDTDGFSTVDDYPIGSLLGELKLEKTFETAQFLAPKLYAWQPKDGPRVVKAKGFSLRTTAQFDRLTMGAEVQIERMARIRENLRDRERHPRDLHYSKRLRQLAFLNGDYREDTMPKRFMYPDGQTRPWHIKEIMP